MLPKWITSETFALIAAGSSLVILAIVIDRALPAPRVQEAKPDPSFLVFDNRPGEVM